MTKISQVSELGHSIVSYSPDISLESIHGIGLPFSSAEIQQCICKVNTEILAVCGFHRSAAIPDVFKSLREQEKKYLHDMVLRVSDMFLENKSLVLIDNLFVFTWPVWIAAFDIGSVGCLYKNTVEKSTVQNDFLINSEYLEEELSTNNRWALSQEMIESSGDSYTLSWCTKPPEKLSVRPSKSIENQENMDGNHSDRISKIIELAIQNRISAFNLFDVSDTKLDANLLVAERKRLQLWERRLFDLESRPKTSIKNHMSRLIQDRANLVKEENERRQERNRLFTQQKKLLKKISVYEKYFQENGLDLPHYYIDDE